MRQGTGAQPPTIISDCVQHRLQRIVASLELLLFGPPHAVCTSRTPCRQGRDELLGRARAFEQGRWVAARRQSYPGRIAASRNAEQLEDQRRIALASVRVGSLSPPRYKSLCHAAVLAPGDESTWRAPTDPVQSRPQFAPPSCGLVEFRELFLRRPALSAAARTPTLCLPCRGLLDPLGDHRATCATSGALALHAAHAIPLERAESRVCQEGGARVGSKFAVEIGGRWGPEPAAFLRLLARARAARAHSAVRTALQAAYVSRWSCIIAVVAQPALASSLLELPFDTVASAAGEPAVHVWENKNRGGGPPYLETPRSSDSERPLQIGTGSAETALPSSSNLELPAPICSCQLRIGASVSSFRVQIGAASSDLELPCLDA